MDAFSEILHGVKLNGAVFFCAKFSAPWGFSSPESSRMAATLDLAGSHLVLFHLMTDGLAVVELPNGESVDVTSGDVVVFPHCDAHLMSSGRGAPLRSQTTESQPKSRRAI